MFVLEVIPLSRTAPPQPLSYRSREDLAPGTLVSVPLRRKIVPGLVIGSTTVQEAKSQLKSAGFSLSRSSSAALGKLPSSLIKAGNVIAAHYATTLGAVLSALLVPVISSNVPARFAKGAGHTIEHIESPTLMRIKRYKKLVETARADSATTLLVVPTQTEADEWAVELKEFAPLVLSGKLTGTRRDATIARACGAGDGADAPASAAYATPLLVIATPGFAWTPVPRLKRIVVERVSAGSYMLPKRPYLNIVFSLTELARARDIPLTYGDYPLPLEYRAGPLQARGKSLKEAPGARVTILDSRGEKVNIGRGKGAAPLRGGAWKAIPDDARAELAKALGNGGCAAVLAVRRGYAPTVVCRDCGTAVTDEYGRTLSLATVNGKRQFRSTDGTTIESAKEKLHCANCGSWNLLPLGVGVERVEEELHTAFPDAPLVRIDSDTRESRTKLIEKISAPGVIIVGTETMLSWLSLHEPVELGVIASADSLLSLPFWRARERFVRIGLMFAERAERLIVATRHSDIDAVLSALTSPTKSDFWQEELSLRKALQYPPFGTLVVFQVEGTSTRLSEARAAIASASTPYPTIELPPRPISASALRSITVLHVPERAWPDPKLSERLARLSPSIRIHIDSESLW